MRYVYVASTFGNNTGSYQLGVFGTRARARRALRREGFTVLHEERTSREYWVKPEDRDQEWPDEHGSVEREPVL